MNPLKGEDVAKGKRAKGVDQLPRGGTLQRPLAHDPLALRDLRRNQGRTCRPKRADPPSDVDGLHGACLYKATRRRVEHINKRPVGARTRGE